VTRDLQDSVLTLKRVEIKRIFIIDTSNQKFLFSFQKWFGWDSKRERITGNTAKVGNYVCNDELLY